MHFLIRQAQFFMVSGVTELSIIVCKIENQILHLNLAVLQLNLAFYLTVT